MLLSQSNLPRAKITQAYSKLLWLWIALSSFVLIEPSPYDIICILCILIGITFDYLSFSYIILLPTLLIGIFIEANLISLLLAAEDMVQATRFFLITLYLTATWIFFVGLLQRYRQAVLKVIFSGYLMAAVLAVIIGVLAYFGLIPNYELFLYFGRISGLFKDANVYGPFLIPMVLYTIYQFECQKDIRRFFWLVMIALLAIGVFLSFSRAAWGNFLISVFLYFVLPPWRNLKERAVKIFFIIIFLMPIIFYTINHPQVSDLLSQRLGYHDYDNDRFGTQLASLKLLTSNPLGIGPYQTEHILNYSTHSLYIRVVTEYGLLGMTSFLCFLVLTVVRSLRHNFCNRNASPYAAIVTASLIGVLFNSIFIDTLHWRHLWLLLALPWIPMQGGGEDESGASGYQV